MDLLYLVLKIACMVIIVGLCIDHLIVRFVYLPRIGIKLSELRQRNSIKHLESKVDAMNFKIKELTKVAPKTSQLLPDKGLGKPFHPEESTDILLTEKTSEPETIELPVSTAPKDTRVWVSCSRDGMTKLEKSDNPTDLYLEKEGAVFVLGILGMETANINNLMKLYGDVLDFPYRAGSG